MPKYEVTHISLGFTLTVEVENADPQTEKQLAQEMALDQILEGGLDIDVEVEKIDD